MTLPKLISAASRVIEDPQLWTRRLPAKFAEQAPRLVEQDGVLTWVLGDRSVPTPLDLTEVAKSASARLSGDLLSKVGWLSTGEGRAWLQGRDQVDGEVLYSIGGIWDLINAAEEPAFVLACYQAYNDWVAELTSQDAEAYIGLARVPTTNVQDAVAELRRAAEQLRLRGAILDSWPDGFDGGPSGPDADPLWEAAASLNLPLSLHQPLGGEKETRPPVHHGAPPAFSLDFNAMVYANLFDRFPALKMVSAYPYISWAPVAFESLGETYMRTSGVRKIQLADDLLPGDYLRTFFWYAVQDDQVGIDNRDYFGAAHLMFGSFSLDAEASAWPNTRALFDKRLRATSAAERQALGSGVVSRLYGLEGTEPFSKEEATAYVRLALL